MAGGHQGECPSPAMHLTGVPLGTCFWSLTHSFISNSQRSGTVGSEFPHPTPIFEQSIPPLSKLCRNLARWGPSRLSSPYDSFPGLFCLLLSLLTQAGHTQTLAQAATLSCPTCGRSPAQIMLPPHSSLPACLPAPLPPTQPAGRGSKAVDPRVGGRTPGFFSYPGVGSSVCVWWERIRTFSSPSK